MVDVQILMVLSEQFPGKQAKMSLPRFCWDLRTKLPFEQRFSSEVKIHTGVPQSWVQKLEDTIIRAWELVLVS